MLGNKTTNAKARTGHTVGVKDMVKEIEKTQAKPTTTQKQKQRSAEVAPIKFNVKADKEEAPEEEEPEYAPPAPKPLPYQSDCLPEGGLTLDGLKSENLLKGFYSHFHNPVDDNGISRKDKEFDDEMKAAMERAVELNERDADALDWTVSDVPETATLFRKNPAPAKKAAPAPVATTRRPASRHQHPPTIASRKAASALAMPADARKTAALKPASSNMPARRPISSLLHGNKPIKSTTTARPASANAAAAEVASRTTIGYNKGRSASSLVHPHGRSGSVKSGGARMAASGPTNEENDLTITPARVRQAALKQSAEAEGPRPQFMSIFDDDEDDEDLPLMKGSGDILEEDEEEFELKLDTAE